MSIYWNVYFYLSGEKCGSMYLAKDIVGSVQKEGAPSPFLLIILKEQTSPYILLVT